MSEDMIRAVKAALKAAEDAAAWARDGFGGWNEGKFLGAEAARKRIRAIDPAAIVAALEQNKPETRISEQASEHLSGVASARPQDFEK